MILEHYTFDNFLQIDFVQHFFVVTEQKKYSIFENHLPCILNLIDGEIEYFSKDLASSTKINHIDGILYFENNKLTLISKH
jgi:F0F1-type ATP synthase epsilon subunit